MNTSNLQQALRELVDASSELARVCEREGMSLAIYWRSVSAEAAALLRSEKLDRAVLERLVRDVASTFSYQPGGFMEMYVVRPDAIEQERENVAFEHVRDAVLAAAGAVKMAAAGGDVKRPARSGR